MKKTAKISTLFFVIAIILLFIFGFSFLFLKSQYPLHYKDTIQNCSQKYNLDKYLVASIINCESSFNTNAVSSKGALGLMQILPSTAKWICKTSPLITFEDDYQLFNPQTNIEIGCRYLKYLVDKFENTSTALCAYNAGEGTVNLWLLNSNYSNDKISLKTVPYNETKNYLSKINNNIKVYKYLF